jgi:uncharacterized membrane protein (Fun14 family)
MDSFYGSRYSFGIRLGPAKIAGKALKELFNLLALGLILGLILRLTVELVLRFVLLCVGTIWIVLRHRQPRR